MKRIILILVLSLAVLAGSVYAQDTPTLTELKLSLWSEYDQPEVLVIYRGSFADDTPLPVPVEVRIPASVGRPTAVAYADEGGQTFNQEHTTRTEGEWLVVSFQLPTTRFQLEYYDTLPVDADGKRTYEFSYVPDYPITSLNLEFQVPPTAENFVLEPAASLVQQEADGLTYHLVQAGPVDQGDTRSWTLTYQKPDSDLTVSAFLQPETPAPAAPAPIDSAGSSTVWIFLVAFVALIGVGATAFWLGQRTHPASDSVPPTSQRQKRRGSGRGQQAERQSAATPGAAEALFCRQCGAGLRHDSEFCHKCGTAVRTR